MNPPYAELHAHSAFSFGDGTATPEALARRGAEGGHTALALADSADLGGLVRFAPEAGQMGVRPIAGAELRVDRRPAVLLARNETGYRNLAALVTHARLGTPRGQPGIPFSTLSARSVGLHALTGGAGGPLAALVSSGRAEQAERELVRWREVFGEHLAVEVQRHHAGPGEDVVIDELIRLAERQRVAWVVTHEPRYLNPSGRLVHDLLSALRIGGDVESAQRRGLLLPNGEWRMRDPAEMAVLWKGYERGLDESTRIADGCSFELRWLRPPLPRIPLPSGYDETRLLSERVYGGAAERWEGKVDARQREQIEHEIRVIHGLGFAGFFLVMSDAVRFARQQGILCQGRGSAANSVVAFCLGITAVDPVRHGLLFERFLSEARTGGLTDAPDIDVDFEAARREEVLNHVYEKYGRDHAAITAVTQEFSAPTAVQDVMRSLGYPAETALPLSRRLHGRGPSEGAAELEAGLAARHGVNLGNARGRTLLAALRAMDGLPRMRSTHPGVFVLSSAPLGEHMPIERTTRGRTVLQFDKDDLDAVGVPKFDFLGLGSLSAVRLTFDAIERRTGKQLELYNLPQDDPQTFQMISRGEALGTFQIESRAQIQSLVQTRPERMYDLVVQVALIRPGPIVAEFVRPYVRRRRGRERITYPHPALEPILARTQGIPILQEQGMSIAMALAGYSAAEADELRRSMGHKRKAEQLRGKLEKLCSRMQERGVERATAERITDDLRVFSAYGFPESHAWSFALIAYATAYLKAHYPAEFLLGLLNAQPMGFYSPATLVHDARRSGVEVRPPCLRDGSWEATLEETASAARPAVRVEWRQIRGLGERARQALQDARAGGPFASVEEVVRRAELSARESLHLARAGALEAWEQGRRAAAWEALRAAGDTLPLAPACRLPFPVEEMEGDEIVFLDYLAAGISLHGHPVGAIRERLQGYGASSTRILGTSPDGIPVVVGGLVVVRQHPESAKGTVFLLIEDEWGMVNVVVPAELYRQNRETVRHSPFLLVEGRLEKNGPVLNVVGRRFVRLEVAALSHRSHDFR